PRKLDPIGAHKQSLFALQKVLQQSLIAVRDRFELFVVTENQLPRGQRNRLAGLFHVKFQTESLIGLDGNDENIAFNLTTAAERLKHRYRRPAKSNDDFAGVPGQAFSRPQVKRNMIPSPV